MADFNYEAAELRKVGIGWDTYRVKITSSEGETRWLSIDARKFYRIADILRADSPQMDMPRAQKLDGVVRNIADMTPFAFESWKRGAPVGSEGWHSFMGDVLAASHNLRVITMERRNELLQELYVVWTGDTSSDSE